MSRRRRNPAEGWREDFWLDRGHPALERRARKRGERVVRSRYGFAVLSWLDPNGAPVDAETAEWFLPHLQKEGGDHYGRRYELQLPLGPPRYSRDTKGEGWVYFGITTSAAGREGFLDVGGTHGFWFRTDPSGRILAYQDRAHADEVVAKVFKPIDAIVMRQMIARLYELVERAGVSRLLRRW